tara:strand:- start:828 stop:1493 length:666 start_codon:yes stop_codon:yes gene_type:complete
MTRSSRYCSEHEGRSKSYKSPHSRKFRRRKDNDVKRSARCQQRSDLAAGRYNPKIEKLNLGNNGVDSHIPNGANHLGRSGRQWYTYEDGKVFTDWCGREYTSKNRIALPEYTWDFDGNPYNLNIVCCREMKILWDKLKPEQRIKVFEITGNVKNCLNYITKISHKGTTLEQFATLVYYIEECCIEKKDLGIPIDVAVKRILRRDNSKKFVSHRNHKDKYAY